MRHAFIAIPLAAVLSAPIGAFAACHDGTLIDVSSGSLLTIQAGDQQDSYKTTEADQSKTALWRSLDKLQICDAELTGFFTVFDQTAFAEYSALQPRANETVLATKVSNTR